MTTTHTTCPDCGNHQTHAETITDLSGPRPVQITAHVCPDCGYKWQTIDNSEQVAKG